MTRGRDRWFGSLVAVATASLAWIAADRILRSGVAFGPDGWVLGAWISTALVAGASFRHRRDTAMLFVATAASILVAQTLAFDTLPDAFEPGSIVARISDASGYAALIAQLGVAICLLMTNPWWDRRGRGPLRPSAVLPIAGALILVADTLVVLAGPSGAVVAGPIGLVRRPSAVTWVLAIATFGILIIAAARAASARQPSGWIAGACVALLIAVVGSLMLPFAGSSSVAIGAVAWIVVLIPVAGTLLLVQPLAAQGREITRLRRASDRASEVMEGRAEIASTIAHDVRGPVGTIKGLATTTRKSYDRLGDPERLEFIGMIEQESGRLLRLVDQVAMGLKIDADALDLHRRLQDIGPMLVHARTQVETTRTVKIDTPDGLEAPIDTRWYSEAVAQGIDNALRFSPPDSSVEVEARLAGADVVVEITDHGPGIPTDQREALFEKFSRWRPVGYDDRTGTGLGLFICRGIARAHGGDATLDDAPGGGTMLRILVPAEERPT